MLIASSALSAPLTLTGDYINLGVSDWGTLGQNGGAQPGLQYDSSGTSNFPQPDYLTPGTPFDGFSITTDGTTQGNNNNAGSGRDITGVLTDESGNGADNRAVWSGTFNDGTDAFTVTRDISFNDDDRRVTIVTSIRAERNLTGVMFSHQIDPDANGESSTNNSLGLGSTPGSDIVFSQAPISQFVLAIFSQDPLTHRAAISAFPWSQDPAVYLAGTNDGNGDNSIGMGFDLGDMLTGDVLTFTYYLLFGNDLADLTATVGGFESIGTTPNQRSVGKALDELGAGNALFDALSLLSQADALAAMDLLMGEFYATSSGVLLDESNYMRSALNDRIRQSFSDISTSYAGQALGYAPSQNVTENDRLGIAFWGQGYGNWGYTGDGASRTDHTLGGFILGADAPIGEFWRWGIAAGYTSTSLDADDLDAEENIDTYSAAIYGGAQYGALGLRFGGTFGLHNIDASRSVIFAGFANDLVADYDARSAQAFAEIGYTHEVGRVAFEPFAGLAYVYLDTDGFTESGGAAALTVDSREDEIGFSTIGLRSATGIALDDGLIVTTRLTLGWRHAFGDVSPDAQFAFAGGTPFDVAGAPIARDALVVNLGVDSNVTENANVGLSYAGQIGDDAQDHGVRANFILAF